jgi:hypothetical protein
MAAHDRTRRVRTAKRIAVALGILAALVAIALVVMSLMTRTEGPRKRTVHESRY